MSQNQPGAQSAGGAVRPGQMTAVMRAMQVAAGPKVLHIGLYQGSKAVEERIIKSRTTVTVGNNEKNTFVLAVPQLPATFKLFELIGNDYYLNFFDGFRGRLALASGITDIADLKGQAKPVGNYYQVKLTEEARGQILIGDRKLLFHFVAPPPVQPRPQLPLAVIGAAAGIDWTLMIIASFSFLGHFGIVGALYSDWLDPPWQEATVAGIVDLVKNIPAPPAPEPDKKVENDDKKVADKTPDSKAPSSGAKPAAAGGAAGPRGAVGDKQAAALAKQAESMEVALLGALGGTTAAEGALRRSEIPGVDISALATSGAGAVAGTSDLKVGGGGGGPIQGGAGGGGGLGNIGGGTGGSGTGQSAGTETKVKGPTGDVGSLSSSTVGAPINNADRVVAGLRGRFKSCYQRGLSEDPTMSGKVTLVAKIGPNGEVTGVTPSGTSGLSPAVVGCLQGVVNRATFDPPGGSGSTVQIPVSFVQQGK